MSWLMCLRRARVLLLGNLVLLWLPRVASAQTADGAILGSIRDSAGVGLANLRTRLQILHGNASELRMSRAGADGVEVVVTLPLTDA